MALNIGRIYYVTLTGTKTIRGMARNPTDPARAVGRTRRPGPSRAKSLAIRASAQRNPRTSMFNQNEPEAGHPYRGTSPPGGDFTRAQYPASADCYDIAKAEV